jgi:hypothetical protein
MKRTKRPRYLRIVFDVALFLALAAVGFSLFFMPRSRRQALSDLMHYKAQQSMNGFVSFMEPVVNNLLVLRRWGEQGMPGGSRPARCWNT